VSISAPFLVISLSAALYSALGVGLPAALQAFTLAKASCLTLIAFYSGVFIKS
jgi:hypothetical protein